MGDEQPAQVTDADGEVVGVGLAVDYWDGSVIDVWGDDSGLWTEWQWEGDHYTKVGGTKHKRDFYPG